MFLWQRYAELDAGWHLLVVVGALVVVAALVNRFARERRASLRRAVTLFALYTLATIFAEAPLGVDARWPTMIHELLEAFTLVHLGGITIFDLVLPRLGILLPVITVDLIFGAAYFITTFAVLTGAGVELGSVMAASGVVAAILTISLQSTLGNVVGGVAMQLDGSLQAGDWLRLENGKEGRVRQVGWRSTVVETRDGDTMIVPNSVLLANTFTLLGKRLDAPHPHRVWVHFHVDFRYSPAQVCEAALSGLREAVIPGMVAEPAPDVVCVELGRDGQQSMGVYAARVWINDLGPVDPIASVVRGRVHAALRRAGINLARPAITQFMVAAEDETEDARDERRHRRAAATLRAIPLFSALTDAEIDALAREARFAPFAAGEVMTRQGNVAHHLYVLQKGEVEVRLEAGGEEHVVARLVAPDIFGEMGLMTGEARAASVVAITDSSCFRLGKQNFQDLLSRRPELAAALSAVLAERRVELDFRRGAMDAATREARRRGEAERILGTIRHFFGLDQH